MKRSMHLVTCLVAASFALACRGQQPAGPEAEPPTLDVTHWTDKTELFMEFPPLVAGRTVLFAVHLTDLRDFSAMTAGRPRIEFTPESTETPFVLQGSEPSRPGVFRVEGVLPPAGRYRWALVVDSPDVRDRHDLGTITIFPDEGAAVADGAARTEAGAATITYTKELQWTNGFATAPVEEAEVRASVRAPATVHPLPGGEAVVAAPAAGRFAADALLSIGDRVRAGQVLGRLEPRLAVGADRAALEAEVSEARVAVEAARVDQARAERLLAERAVPARRVEDARRTTLVAEARLHAAEARLAQHDETLRTGGSTASGNAFVLRAPIAGRLAEVMATLGASYDEGAPLFRIVRTDRVELEVQVPPPDVSAARQTTGLGLEIPGIPGPFELEPRHVHDSGVVDPRTRALALQMEIANPGERLLVGQTGTAILYTGARHRLPVVPAAAVLMEAGRPYVFVQLGGERFGRRFIDIAARDGALVGVSGGVMPGERVVTRGAYDVRLAAAAGELPAEGHVH
ncbi:MAG TPA: efflux RND transporter periplasmic adaptor subunit [Vicinamibacterales bacterium]|nr:efflux RND transporter periplasmic adaptor subunit [Vicinamibacterales bacterium]